MTQAELARRAHVTVSYVWRLESAGAAPGIDLLARLAEALAVRSTELLPTSDPDSLPLLGEQAERLFGSLVKSASRETLLMLNPLLARLVDVEKNRCLTPRRRDSIRR